MADCCNNVRVEPSLHTDKLMQQQENSRPTLGTQGRPSYYQGLSHGERPSYNTGALSKGQYSLQQIQQQMRMSARQGYRGTIEGTNSQQYSQQQRPSYMSQSGMVRQSIRKN